MHLWCCFVPFFVCLLGVSIFNILSENVVEQIKACFTIVSELELDLNYFLSKDSSDSKMLASSVWCFENPYNLNICHFKNVYYFPQHKDYIIFVLNEFSAISGLKSSDALKHIKLSTIENHVGFNLKLIMIKSTDYLLQHTFKVLNKDTFLMKRFKPDNIMHVIHDDLLPLFHTYKELCFGNVQLCLSKYQLGFLDNNDEGPFYEWYLSFSKSTPIFLSREKGGVCFKNILIGLSHSSLWYQYGFKSVQGPLSNSFLNGFQLKQFTEFIKNQFKINNVTSDINKPTSMSPTTIVFLSRKVNRQILNEQYVEQKVIETYKNLYKKDIEIVNLDLSVNSSKSLILSIQKTRVLIGMHGSAMILAMFLPQGSTIIELFPFGIQPHVSPVKALCALPLVSFDYFYWINDDERNTLVHLDYPPLLGGISHLPLSEQNNIMRVKSVPPVECCHNPLYLFRMFQDTIVGPTFFSLFLDVLSNNPEMFTKELLDNKQQDVAFWYVPPPVLDISCKCVKSTLEVKWSFPFGVTAEVKFSLATSTGITEITDKLYFKKEMEQCYKNKETDNPIEILIWIKTLDGEKESIDTYFRCIIT